MARYFVPWLLEEEVEDLLDAPVRHGEIVGQVVVSRHITGQYAGSAEILIVNEEAIES